MNDQITPNQAPAPAQTPATGVPAVDPQAQTEVAPASTDQPNPQSPAINATQSVSGGPTPTPPSTPAQSQQFGKYEVRIINDKCIGAASCVAISPATLKMNEQNIAEVISQNDTDDNKLLAAQSCPTAAVEIIDTSTGELVWPR